MEVMEQAFTCPICADFFTDPVSLPCGHNFCKTCIQTVWNINDSEATSRIPLFCPECQIFLPYDLTLIINSDLQQHVQNESTIGSNQKKTASKSASVIMCDHCIEGSSVAVKYCLKCDASLCSAHTLHHQHRERLKDHTLIEVTEDLLSYKCQQHGEELKLFCEDHQVAVCSLCVAIGEHKCHQVVQLQKACADFKKSLEEKEAQLLLRIHMAECAMQDCQQLCSEASYSAKSCRRKIEETYSQMKALIEKDQQLMMNVIEMEELYTCKWLESKRNTLAHQTEDIKAMLNANRSLLKENDQLKLLKHLNLNTLGVSSEIEALSSMQQEHNVCNSQRIKTVEHLTESLYEALFQNTRRLWANLKPMHLDAETAHPKLEVSSDLLEVRWSKQPKLSNQDTEERHDEYSVLAKEYFSSGSHYWETIVWDKPYWLIGLSCKTSGELQVNAIHRDETHSGNFSKKAFCYIYHGNGRYLVCNGSEENILAVKTQIQKLGICLDLEKREVSFYDADTVQLLHLCVSELGVPVSPIFNTCLCLNEQNSQPLILFNLRDQKTT